MDKVRHHSNCDYVEDVTAVENITRLILGTAHGIETKKKVEAFVISELFVLLYR
jgi:hypothetical protein